MNGVPLDPYLLAVIFGLGFLAGVVKGCVGFALPTILIAGLGAVLPAEAALAALILPTLVTNVWQGARNGVEAAIGSARAHWRYIAMLLLLIAIGAQFVTSLPDGMLFLIIGVPVVIFAALQLLGWRPVIRPEHRIRAEYGVGAFAGTLGGLSGVWGPPTALYLTALNTPKAEATRVQGVIYSVGAVMLALAHIQSGILNTGSLTLSGLVLIPSLIGMAVGFFLQDRMNQDRFRRMTLAVLVIAGLNLVRRGLMG